MNTWSGNVLLSNDILLGKYNFKDVCVFVGWGVAVGGWVFACVGGWEHLCPPVY